MTDSTDAEGHTTRFAKNEKHQTIKLTDPTAQVYRTSFNGADEVDATFLPGGQATRIRRHHSGQEAGRVLGNDLFTAANFTWPAQDLEGLVKAQSGHPYTETDLGGEVVTRTLNYINLPVVLQGSGGDHGQEQPFDRTQPPVPVPNKNIKLSYMANGVPWQVADDGAALTGLFFQDIQGRRVGARFLTSDGQVHQDVRQHLNALDDIEEVSDVRYAAKFSYDAARNRRRIQAWVLKEGGEKVDTVDDWYDYDGANRMTIEQGVLDGGQIKIATDKGRALTYSKTGFIYAEQWMDSAGNLQTKTLAYYANGQLKGYTATDGTNETRVLDEAGRLKQIDQAKLKTAAIESTLFSMWSWLSASDQLIAVQDVFTYDDINKDWLTVQSHSEDGQTKYSTHYAGADGAGYMHQQNTDYPPADDKSVAVHDALNLTYVAFNTLFIEKVSGTRTAEHFYPSYAALNFTRDADGGIRTVDGQ